MYPVNTSWWLRALAPRGLVWSGPVTATPAVYLSFDDGPHPVATPFVLQQLRAYEAKATFFCIGKCVEAYPEIFRQTIAEGHTVGNHTQHHLNGYKTATSAYLSNIAEAAVTIPSRIFRPPYGRINRAQTSLLQRDARPWKVYMWSLLSGDFDRKLSPEQCLSNVLRYLQPRDIVVFHDSEKAWERLCYVLPFVLDYCKQKGWALRTLPAH